MNRKPVLSNRRIQIHVSAKSCDYHVMFRPWCPSLAPHGLGSSKKAWPYSALFCWIFLHRTTPLARWSSLLCFSHSPQENDEKYLCMIIGFRSHLESICCRAPPSMASIPRSRECHFLPSRENRYPFLRFSTNPKRIRARRRT